MVFYTQISSIAFGRYTLPAFSLDSSKVIVIELGMLSSEEESIFYSSLRSEVEKKLGSDSICLLDDLSRDSWYQKVISPQTMDICKKKFRLDSDQLKNILSESNISLNSRICDLPLTSRRLLAFKCAKIKYEVICLNSAGLDPVGELKLIQEIEERPSNTIVFYVVYPSTKSPVLPKNSTLIKVELRC